METTQKNILIGGIVALIIIVGGVYFYSAKPVALPVNDAQNLIDNNVANAEKKLNIVSAESKATYEIDEKLQGKPTHVVGTTQSITGNIKVNTATPSSIQIGEIKIDATSFKTDIAKRDENVVDLVLKSNKSENKYITFTPISVNGMPTAIETGKDFPVEISGDMKMLGITKLITFKGVASFSSDNTLIINANTTLSYGDFGITIPNFSFLSDVDKMVKLTVSLVAR